MSKAEASEWRIKLAAKVAEYYTSRPDCVMAVIGGSPSRGLSDEYSDIDLIIYWSKLDEQYIDSFPLKEKAGEPALFLDHRKQGSMMELYKLETLIVEVGHISMDTWTQMVDQVLVKHDINPMIQKSLGGFLDSHVLYGETTAKEWKSKIREYPEQLARNMIQRNLGFIWKGCIEHQGLDRGETVFFYDALGQTVKRLMALLSALNRRYFAVQEPRWIEYELSLMNLKPVNMWSRIQNLYKADPYDAVSELYQLIEETVIMVRQQFPDLNYTIYDDCDALLIEKTPEMPAF